jgi:hypothetical protein
VGCVGLYHVQYIIYFGDEDKGKFHPPQVKDKPDENRWLLNVALVAVLCLSVVGAVCSAEASPECRGNSEIHYTAAITFFVLYDAYMAVLVSARGSKGKLHHYVMLCVSLFTKVRFLPHALPSWGWLVTGLGAGGFPAIAVFEWCNVGSIISFTASYTAAVGEGYQVALLERDGDDDQRGDKEDVPNGHHRLTMGDQKWLTIWKLDGHAALRVALRYAFGTLVMCLVTSIVFDTIDHDRFPFISDTFVFPPGNCQYFV